MIKKLQTKNTMKIGIDARVLFNANMRGMGKYLYYLLKYFKKNKPEYKIILYFAQDSRKMKSFDLFEFEQNRISIKGSRFGFWEQIRLPIEIRKEKLDLFHSPAEVIPYLQPTKFIVTLHGMMMWERDEGETRITVDYYRKFLPLALKKAKKIITVSEYTKKDIMNILSIPEERINVIYNGVEHSVFHRIEDPMLISETKRKFGIVNKYIFAIGAEGPCKNTLGLIDTFFEFKKNFREEIQLVIAGIQEKSFEKFKTYIDKLGLKEDVVLIGYLSEFISNELTCLYSGAELFINISLYESFGIPNIEAMACGAPVITSNVKAIPEIVSDAAILVDPLNKTEIINEIKSILGSGIKRNDLIQRGLRRASCFTWEKTAENTLKVYESVLGSK